MESNEKSLIPQIRLINVDPSNEAVRAAVLHITHTAFMIDPETGEPIESDTPSELPMTAAMMDRGAVKHLHAATIKGEIVAYVLYTEGTVTNNPGIQALGLTIMGVLPEHQRKGIGTRLLTWSVEQVQDKWDLLFVLGHPKFYPLAGFVTADSLNMTFAIPAPKEACMVKRTSGRAVMPGIIDYNSIVHEFF
jgi:predicted N-acetyltransferase YhbS